MQQFFIRKTTPTIVIPLKTQLTNFLRSKAYTSSSYLRNQSHSAMVQEMSVEQPPTKEKCPDDVFVQNNSKDMMTISFTYSLNGKTKQFNMYRKAEDPLTTSIDRIKLNMLKLTKKPTKLKNKIVEEDNPSLTDQVHLLIDGKILNPTNVKNSEAWVEGAVLELNGKPHYIRANYPGVESLKLPSCIMKNFIVMPNLSLSNCVLEDCRFAWYRQISADEHKLISQDKNILDWQIENDGKGYWYKLSDSITYCPVEDDVAHNLKFICIPINGERIGAEVMYITDVPVEVGPSYFPFEKRHYLTQELVSRTNEFRVISYNILADLYVDTEYSRTVLFGHCPSHALDLDYRRQIILKELFGYNGDLICLQEVDKKEYIRTYEPFFKLVGNHSGVFDTKGGTVAEGQATFYRNSKFEFVHTHKTLLADLIEPRVSGCTNPETESAQKVDEIEDQTAQQPESVIKPHLILADRDSELAKKCLMKFDHIREAILSNGNLKKRFIDRHTILQTTLLKVKGTINKYLLVANTHLYFAPDADHVRLLQGSVCVKYLEFIKEFYMERYGCKDISVVLCGDMNSTPDCGLYKLLTKGKVTSDLPDWSSNSDEVVVNLSVETNLKFSSAYEDIPFTNYTPGFNGCLDYIYYEDSLNCDSIVPLPDLSEVTAIGGLPSDVFPSDHLALIANLNYHESIN